MLTAKFLLVSAALVAFASLASAASLRQQGLWPGVAGTKCTTKRTKKAGVWYQGKCHELDPDSVVRPGGIMKKGWFSYSDNFKFHWYLPEGDCNMLLMGEEDLGQRLFQIFQGSKWQENQAGYCELKHELNGDVVLYGWDEDIDWENPPWEKPTGPTKAPVRKNIREMWSTGTKMASFGGPCPDRELGNFKLEDDGSLVLYDKGGKKVWYTTPSKGWVSDGSGVLAC